MDIQFIDLAIFLKKHKTLIICDTHIGYEGMLQDTGIMLPSFSFNDQLKKIKEITNKVNFEQIIINGDFKEEFGKINDIEWRNAKKFLEIFKNKKKVIIKGNHDQMIKKFTYGLKINFQNKMIFEDILICHGDKVIKESNSSKINTIIIGHEHPAIQISDKIKKETYKCYLLGKYKKKRLIVQPSFKLGNKGTDILTKKQFLSPYLKDIANFDVLLVADKIYNFGNIMNIEKNIEN